MVVVVARVLVVALVASMAMVPMGAPVAAEGATDGGPETTADAATVVTATSASASASPPASSSAPSSAPAASLAGGVQALDMCPAAGEVDTDFGDVAGNTHEQAIECLVWAVITQGVAPGVFDPSGAVTRGQMASFLVRMLAAHGVELEAAPLAFTDVEPDAAHADAIAQLVGAEITQGVDDQRFAPGAVVTRGQMASFLTRTVELVVQTELPANESGFDDIAASTHREAIEKTATVGLAAGVSADRFDPGAEVRRDQMASFLARTLSYLAVNDPGLELPSGLLPGAEPTSSGTPEPRPGVVEFELGEDTVEVEEPQEASLIDDTLTIAVDELAEPEPGDYLVSYGSEALPLGLHHRVVEVARSGDQWVIELEGAELWEPYEELELDVTVAPDEESMAELVEAINEQTATATEPVFTATLEDPASTAGAQLADAGVTVPRAFEGSTITLTLQEPHPREVGEWRDGITVYEDAAVNERVAVHLDMALQPTLNLAFDGGGWFSGPDYAYVSMRLDADVDIAIKGTSAATASCDLTADADDDPDKQCPQRIRDNLDAAVAKVPTNALQVIEGAQTVLEFAQLAKRFPTKVSVEPTFPLSVELNADGLIEASISSWVEIGAEYDSDTGLSGVLLYPQTGDPDEPRVDITGEATVEARAQAGVGLRVLIANTFGPTVSGTVFGEVDGGATLQRLSAWSNTPFFDAWATARVGLNAKAEVGVQDPIFGRLSASWTVYDRDVATFDLYRSTPGAPLLRTVGEVDGNLVTLAWTEPTHATRYLIAAGPTQDTCRLEAQFGTRPQGAQRLTSRPQTPATIALPDVDWDDIHLCIAAVDGTLDRTSPASDTVIVQRIDDDEPTPAEILPGISAATDSYRSGRWVEDDGEIGGWERVRYDGDPDRRASIEVRKLPGWWAAEALVDAIETSQGTYQGFQDVEVRDLRGDPRFPDATRALEVTATNTIMEDVPSAIGDRRWYLLDHGDHVVQVAWQSDVGFEEWRQYRDRPVKIDPAGLELADSIEVRGAGTASLATPVDPSEVDWRNATIEYRPQRGTGISQDWPLTDGTFDGVSPGSSRTYTITLLNVAYGDAFGRDGLDALLLLDSTATDQPFAMVMSQRTDGSWEQLDVMDGSLSPDVDRLTALEGMLLPVTEDRARRMLVWQPTFGLFAGVG